MRIDTLEDLYIEQLNDIYSANNQALSLVKDLALAASDRDLANALASGADGIQDGVDVIAAIAESHDECLDRALCKGIESLLSEAQAHALTQDFGEANTRDAMIIVQYQRLAHFAIAGYGCLVAFADRLELDQDLTALRGCLETSYNGDQTMTDLALDRINRAAMG